MAIGTANKLMTAEELLALGPDFHGELVRGRLIEMAPASWGHGISGSSALLIIGGFVRDNILGRVFTAETGFTLTRDPDTVRAPDVAFVSNARIPQTEDRSGFFEGPPDLAVEIVSPSNTFSELSEKVDDYFVAGTKLVWIIDAGRRTITVYTSQDRPVVLREADTLSGEDVLPGFTIVVSQFFV